MGLNTLAPATPQVALLLGRAEVEEALSLELAFESQVMAFMNLARNEATAPDMRVFPGDGDLAWTACHAARAGHDSGVVAKLVSVAETNSARGLPTVVGVVAVLDPQTGLLAALMDGTAITTLRTAAASAVAAATLAGEAPRRLAVIGAGVQARAHVRALTRALPAISEVRIYSRSVDHREQAAAELSTALQLDVRPTNNLPAAIRGAGVIVLCTHSQTPVLPGDEVESGAVVISIGSYAPGRCEVDDRLLERAARIIVDHRPGQLRHGGPIIRAMELGLTRANRLVELGQVLLGKDPGRRSPTEILFYNSVGLGVQDAAAAWTALHRARELGLGRPINL
jgi:ornithine cyclodeaminase/alanine dehydrogenase-like protein (mu-crystallin family)